MLRAEMVQEAVSRKLVMVSIVPQHVCHARAGRRTSVVRDDAEEAAVNRDAGVAGVLDEAEIPELVHEVIDARPGRADHLRQIFLVDSWNHGLGPALLAKMGEQQEQPGQALLAGVEQLIDEIPSYRMFRASRRATNISASPCCSWSSRAIVGFSTRASVQSPTAIAVAMRNG